MLICEGPEKALGTFDGWDDSALSAVTPGDTVEITGALQIVSLQTLLRLFKWFAAQAQDHNSPFVQKGEELKTMKAGLKSLEVLLGGTDEVLAMLLTEGDPGPAVAVVLDANWLIGALGRLDGTYTVVAQAEMVLDEDDRWPTVRLTTEAPVTKFERDTRTEVVGNFVVG